jgi:hypothetical protein
MPFEWAMRSLPFRNRQLKVDTQALAGRESPNLILFRLPGLPFWAGFAHYWHEPDQAPMSERHTSGLSA